jgi:hypothetical protein
MQRSDQNKCRQLVSESRLKGKLNQNITKRLMVDLDLEKP